MALLAHGFQQHFVMDYTPCRNGEREAAEAQEPRLGPTSQSDGLAQA